MASIDRADWHYGGDFLEELQEENGGTHIGMYLTWIIENNLIGQMHIEDSKEGINAVKERRITGRDFLFDYCDGKFWEDDLSDQGLKFTNYYYHDKAGEMGLFIEDYYDILASEYETIYHVPNTWENYDMFSVKISEAYNNWLNKKAKKPWQFWKK